MRALGFQGGAVAGEHAWYPGYFAAQGIVVGIGLDALNDHVWHFPLAVVGVVVGVVMGMGQVLSWQQREKGM